MGITKADMEIASRLFAKKTVLNEFLAFHDMGKGLHFELIFTCPKIPSLKAASIMDRHNGLCKQGR